MECEHRFERNWYALRERRISLVRQAQGGDEDAMLALRSMALKAGVFAGLSINNPVWRQEKVYGEWLMGATIRGLPAHQCVERIGAWTATMTLAMLADESGVKFAESACTIKYLGPAKAHFFAACMGYDHVPCIDVHMSRLLRERGVMKQKLAPGGFRSYRRLVDASGWGTMDQWRAFLAVPPQFPNKPCFADTHHDVLMKSMIGERAVCA